MSSSAPVVSLTAVTHRYGAVVADAGIDLEIPAGTTTGFIGPDGAGKSTLLALIAGAKRIQTGGVAVLGGDMARPAAPGRGLSQDRVHGAGAGQEPVPNPVGFRERRLFWPALRPVRDRAGAAHPGAAGGHRAVPVRRSTGRKTLRRDEAQARAVLRPDPRPRTLDPGRADDRPRSALPPSVLGADRAHPRRPAGDERVGRHRVHGGGGAV